MASARAYDLNGWFEVKDNPISREGVFPYSGAQIGAPADQRDKIFQVYRPGSELSAPEALDSFRLVPIIDDHTMLGDGHTAAEDKGVAGVIGEQVKFANGIMTANLKIHSKSLAEKIKNGKTELSCGYRCAYEFTPGEWDGQKYDVIQRQIRANHLALVDEGRMGPEVAILDRMTFTADAKEQPPVDEELKAMLVAIMARLEKLEAAAPEVKEEVKVEDDETEAETKVADEETETKVEDEEVETKVEDAEEPKAMDAMLKRIAALEKSNKALAARPAMDDRAMLKTIAQKGELVEKLRPLIGAFDHAAMTYADVAAYGVKKLAIKGVTKGNEAIALDAYLQAARAAQPHIAQDSAPTDAKKAIDAFIVGTK